MGESRVALVTGCSSGIGQDLAGRLVQRGYEVVATARRVEDLSGLQAGTKLSLDVTDDASVGAAVEAALAAHGRIDVLVNNAGFSLPGAIEDRPEAIRAMFETNLFGALRLIRAVSPTMRRQGQGRIVNIGSISGRWSLALWGGYSATKAALASITYAARGELGPFGIKVVLVEPGPIRTGFHPKTELAFEGLAENASSPYSDLYRRGRALNAALHGKDPGPEAVSRIVLRAIEARRPALHYFAGLSPGIRLVLAAPVGLREAFFEAALARVKA